MEYIKNLPGWLAHSIFVNSDTEIDELNGSELNLFFLLIFLTSDSYDHDKNIAKTITYDYKKTIIQTELNVSDTILKKSISKLNGLEVVSNTQESYDDNKLNRYKPFIISDRIEKGKIIYAITVEEEFIKEFSKPKYPFTLSYQYLSKFSNTQAKLLYIFLFDYLGRPTKEEEKKEYRNKKRIMTMNELAIIMNREFDCSPAKIKRDIASSIELINEHTDIKITNNTYTDKPDGKLKCVFQVERVKPYQLYESKASKDKKEEDKDADADIDKSQKILEEEIEKEADRRLAKQIQYGNKIKNQVSYRKSIVQDIKTEKKEEALQNKFKTRIDKFLKYAKSKKQDKIDSERDGAILTLFFKNIDNKGVKYFFIDNEYLIKEPFGESFSKNAEETLNIINQHIEDNKLSYNIEYIDKNIDNIKNMYF